MIENNKKTILWIDDEIELLKPHIILLNQRGYEVDTCTNGSDAIELVKEKPYNLVFLDEMMLGMSGLETLAAIKDYDPNLPVVMVTKNEEETLMEEAIGRKISDYLTKPVNPAQVLAVCKKFIDASRISKEVFTQDYITGFAQISSQLFTQMNWTEWDNIYRKLVAWSLEIDKLEDGGLKETLQGKWIECNQEFSRFVELNYKKWIDYPDAERNEENPIMSPHILDNYLLPILKEQSEHIYLIVIDCMRYDQWLVMQEMLYPFFNIKTDLYCSILPTATPYARNAIFAGLYPIEIKEHYPQYWTVNSNTEDHKQNAYEKELLEQWLTRRRMSHKDKMTFIKIFDTEFGKKVEREFDKYMKNQLTAIVVNAVDMIAHSRSDHAILKEIAPDESAYRSLTKSWFTYSSLYNMLKIIATQKDAKVIITTDHGSIRCLRGVKVLGDKETSTNLRYKFGKNVNSAPKSSLQLENLADFKLPKAGLSVNNLIAKEDYYFVYPTDFHHYMTKFRDSFQHGGISLEEMMIPVIELESK
ncbi:MAG: PglZ domain-containing protein [Ignavibacteria bacterium]|jgi:CheY-like chemotaxis protein|nr:PglZ domain-containing protein [Ignavibacteria bacterium]